MSKVPWRSEISLVLSALLIAFVIWIMAKMSTQQTEALTVPVVIENFPANVKIDYDPKTIPIVITYPQSQRSRVSNQSFEVRLNLQEVLGSDARAWAGERKPTVHTVNLTLDNVHRSNVPESVRVAALGQTSRIQVGAMLYSQNLPVEVETSGNLPPNFELRGAIRVNPANIPVTAAQDILGRLTESNAKLHTEPVSLEGKSKDFIDFVTLKIPPGLDLVKPDERKVEVIVGIKEKEISRTIEGVPVQIFVLSPDLKAAITPSVAHVRVKGDTSIVNRVEPEMFTFASRESFVEEAGARKMVELTVAFDEETPKDIREKIEIESVSPSKVEISFIPIEKPGEKPKNRK